MDDLIKEKLKNVFEITLEEGLKYDGGLVSIDYYNLFCEAAAKNKLYSINGNNFCAYNYLYENSNAIMMVFAIPINIEEGTVGNKYIAERIMDIVRKVEDCFVTLDYVNSREVEEDKFVYVVVVKKTEEDE